MTAIAIWLNDESPEHPALWVAADSRISAPKRILLEDGAKILPLQIVCRSPGADGSFTQVSYAHSIGYCFAGSTLMGQNTYLSLAPLLSNLTSVAGYAPAISDVAQYVHAYLRNTFDEYKTRVGEAAMFEAAIFGYCHRTGRHSVFHFRPEKQDGMWMLGTSVRSDMRSGDFQYLGDEKSQVMERLSRSLSGESFPGRAISRMPRYVIEDCINDDLLPSIGGDLQLGIASPFGFQPFMLCKPRTIGKPEAFFSYLGRELTPELTFVGEARVGGPAMT